MKLGPFSASSWKSSHIYHSTSDISADSHFCQKQVFMKTVRTVQNGIGKIEKTSSKGAFRRYPEDNRDSSRCILARAESLSLSGAK